MSNLIDRTLDIISKRQYNAKNNISNCIPCPLPRLSKEWAGLERRKYIVVAGSDKSSKTQFSSFLFVYHSLHYAMKHPEVKVDVLYYNLEEDREDIMNRYILYLLKVKHNIISNNDELLSTGKILPDNIYSIIHSPSFKEYLTYFDNHVTFSTTNTVPEMIREIKEWNGRFGKYDENGKFTINYQNHYRIVLVDHIGLIDAMRNDTLFNTLKTFSHKCIQMRDAYNLTICNIQQCSANSEGLEAIKMSRLLPSKYVLSDYKGTIQDVSLMIGIFNPAKVNLNTFNGYLIYDELTKEDVLGDNARFINIMANRGGKLGAILPLYTDGSNAYFEEVPSLREHKKLEEYYNKVKEARKQRESESEPVFNNKPLIPNNNFNNMPDKKPKVIRSFFAKILSISKNKKKYDVSWDVNSLPDKLYIDGYNLIPMVSTDGTTCEKCWFDAHCHKSNIPCTPLVYWVPENAVKDTTDNVEITEEKENKKNKKIKNNTTKKIGF